MYNTKESDFPRLSSPKPRKKIASTWSTPLNIQIKEKKKDDVVLSRNTNETDVQLYNRLHSLFKETTCLNTYNVYYLNYKGCRTYVAARNSLIARYLCQARECREKERQSMIISNEHKKKIMQDMRDDEYLYDEIMDGFDDNEYHTAVAKYCSRKESISTSMPWLNEDRTSCVKTDEICISKEKILH